MGNNFRSAVLALVALALCALPINSKAGSSVSAPPPGWTLIASSGSLTSGSAVNFASIPSTYSDLLIVIDALNTGTSQVLRLGINTNTTVGTISSANSAFNGAIYIPSYRRTVTMFAAGVAVGGGADSVTAGSATFTGSILASGGISAVQISTSAVFSSGNMYLYAR